jgi:uridylate kinase
MENNLPIIVFDIAAPDGILQAVGGERIGTIVADRETVLEPA